MQVYADNAATMKMKPEVVQAVTEAMNETYGNPSGVYGAARDAKIAMEAARYSIASQLGAKTNEIFFTSGGSESNTQALLSAAAMMSQQGKTHIITTDIEHASVRKPIEQLEAMGFTVTTVHVGKDGVLDPARIHEAIREETAVVSVMMANNEIGTIQPIREIGALCHIGNTLFHVDAVQAAGHLPIDVTDLDCDLLSLSAHKFGGPKGVGALYARSNVDLSPLILGGPQERGRRAGTENVPGIVGMAEALDLACDHMAENTKKTLAMRDRLMDGLLAIPGTTLNGDREKRLPGNVSVCFDGISSEVLLVKLDEAGICASAGSACQAGSLDPSPVLLAIGRTEEEAMSSLRLTINEDNNDAEIDYLIATITKCVEELRK